jgi:hypothetical protein
MSFFNKSDVKTDLSVNHGNVLFPHGTSNEQIAENGSGAILRDGKITFLNHPGSVGPSEVKKPQA